MARGSRLQDRCETARRRPGQVRRSDPVVPVTGGPAGNAASPLDRPAPARPVPGRAGHAVGRARAHQLAPGPRRGPGATGPAQDHHDRLAMCGTTPGTGRTARPAPPMALRMPDRSSSARRSPSSAAGLALASWARAPVRQTLRRPWCRPDRHRHPPPGHVRGAAVVTGLHVLARLIPAWQLTRRPGTPVPGPRRRAVALLCVPALAGQRRRVLAESHGWRAQRRRDMIHGADARAHGTTAGMTGPQDELRLRTRTRGRATRTARAARDGDQERKDAHDDVAGDEAARCLQGGAMVRPGPDRRTRSLVALPGRGVTSTGLRQRSMQPTDVARCPRAGRAGTAGRPVRPGPARS